MSIMRNKEGIRLTEIEKDYSDGKTKQSFPKMSDTDYLRWAYENQDKILAAYERQRKYQ